MLVIPVAAATDEGKVTVTYGKMTTYCTNMAVQNGDVTYLSLRDVFSAYGIDLVWAEGEAEKKVIFTTGAQRYQLKVDLEQGKAIGLEKTYDIKYIDGSLYMPLHFYINVINCEVKWDGENTTLTIGDQLKTNNVAVEESNSDAQTSKKLVNLSIYEKTVAVARSESIVPTLTYLETGEASYYGEKFHGRRTASGAVYNMNELTAAHKTLSFGTVVRVTALYNNASVDVTITDRGPYTHGRVIDLSKAAAQQIGLLGRGVGPVKIEIISN